MNIDSQLLTVIESLTDAVNVSNESKFDPDKGYPYATGYSRSTMQHAIDVLTTIVEQYRNITCEQM